MNLNKSRKTDDKVGIVSWVEMVRWCDVKVMMEEGECNVLGRNKHESHSSFQFFENRAKMLRLRTRNRYVMVKSAETLNSSAPMMIPTFLHR